MPDDAAAMQMVKALIRRGMDTFFGVPGGPVCPVFEAIRCSSEATLVESRHETHAAFAAALWHRATGRTPVVVVTAAPGVTNLVTGAASASLERIPMLILAGDVAWMSSGGLLAQDSGPEGVDAETLHRPHMRCIVRISHGASAVAKMLAAVEAARDPFRPGPALCILPLDAAMQTAAPFPISGLGRRTLAPDATRQDAKTALEWLSQAHRPLIVVGAGCRWHGPTLTATLNRLPFPFLTTPRAKGLADETHPRSLRNGGMAASAWARRYTAEPVDACLVLGTDLDDTSVGPTPCVGGGGRLIHVDTDPRAFGRNRPTALAVHADVGSFLGHISDALTLDVRMSEHGAAALADAKSVGPFGELEMSPRSVGIGRIRTDQALRDLEAASAPFDPRFVTDIGEHMLFALHFLTARRPDSFHIQLNLGSMGSGIAGSIGLALADRRRLTVCVAGDGGMHMAGWEALVAMRMRLPILFAVMNDGRYNMVHHGMKQIFGAAEEYAMPPVDFAAWAASFGMPAAIVERTGQIDGDLIARLTAHGGPCLLDIRIDPDVRIKGGGRVEALQHMSMRQEEGGVR